MSIERLHNVFDYRMDLAAAPRIPVARQAVIDEARTWIGTRYHHQASLKGVGADCIGFIRGVAEACGIAEAKQFAAATEYRGYTTQPNPEMLMQACERFLERIPIPDVNIADVLVMKFYAEPQHFGLLSSIGPPMMIHCYARGKRCVVEHTIDALWHSRIVRAYRFRGIS